MATGDLKGQTAIVTGAARGLGLVIATDLAREGMRVAGADVKSDELSGRMREISEKYGVETLAFGADVGDEKAVTSLTADVIRRWGRLDVLVNNAGIRQVAPVWETSTAMWDRIHDANLKGHFLCTREALSQYMLTHGEGVIIFISSGSGKKGEEDSSAYCASKWGIIGFAESVAKDLKKTRIRVTTLTPGMILTPMAKESEVWHLGLDWLDPDPVSQAVVFCIKQDSNTIIPELRIYHRAQV
jgi:NAD(P)-dependent dehydrogenase (short-subunit alcohol dehydrogenase family)